jgi:hypothetical protein
MTKLAITIVTILIPAAASAHPGHGSGETLGLIHYLTAPFHVWSGLIAVGVPLLLVAAWWAGPRVSVLVRRRR